MSANKKTSKKAKETQQKSAVMVGCYMKDASFEAKRPAQAYSDQPWEPDANVDMRSLFQNVNDTVWEAILVATVTVKLKDETVFVSEVHQGATIVFQGEYTEDEKQSYLNTTALYEVFPFLRYNVADMVARGGFPPLYINQIDFESEYKVRKDSLKEENSNG